MAVRRRGLVPRRDGLKVGRGALLEPRVVVVRREHASARREVVVHRVLGLGRFVVAPVLRVVVLPTFAGEEDRVVLRELILGAPKIDRRRRATRREISAADA